MARPEFAIKRDEQRPQLAKLTLDLLRKAAKGQLGLELESRTLTAGWQEALAVVRARAERNGWVLSFTCADCSSPVPRELPACWACGLPFDAPDDEDEITIADLRQIAQELNLADIDLMGREELASAIEAEEKRRRELKDPVRVETECRRLVEHVRSKMPESWSERNSGTGTTFFDGAGWRRIFVPHRSLLLHFVVPDGALDGVPGLVFFSPSERKRRHFGRSNYRYEGNNLNELVQAIEAAIEVVAG